MPLVTRHLSPFGPASIKVMQRTFNPQNRARYPGGPPFFRSEDGESKMEDGGARICYLRISIFHLRFKNAGSSNRRTAPFEGANAGAIPAPTANVGKSSFDPPGGEIESRLAYTQKSEGQNLTGRPLPRCIIRSAPVSDTGGPGAKPGEAANSKSKAKR